MNHRLKRSLKAALPAIIVTLPHWTAYPIGDLKDWTYSVPAETGTGFLTTISRTISHLKPYLIHDSNLRPVSRILTDIETWFAWETAHTTGISPHIVNGTIRLLLVGAVAISLHRLVGLYLPPGSFAKQLTPLLFAATLLVTAQTHPVLYAPLLMLGGTLIILWVPILITENSLTNPHHKTNKLKLTLWGLSGLAAGFWYEMVWLTPIFAAITLITANQPKNTHPKKLAQTAAGKHWIAYTTGTGLAALTVTAAQKLVCWHTGYCGYVFAAVDITEITPTTVLTRILTGIPYLPVHTTDIRITATQLTTSGFLTLATLGLIWWCFTYQKPQTWAPTTQTQHKTIRMLTAGTSFLLLPALAVSTFWDLYECGLSCLGVPWKETLIIQIGWTLILIGGIHTATRKTRTNPTTTRLICVTILATTATFAVATLLGNDTTARTFRQTTKLQYATLATQITHFVDNPTADQIRCLLADHHLDPGTIYDLQNLTQHLHGQPFCSKPIFKNVGEVWDITGTRYETEQTILANWGIRQLGCQRSVTRFACPYQPLFGAAIRHILQRTHERGHLPSDARTRGEHTITDGAAWVTRLKLAETLTAAANTQPEPTKHLFTDITDPVDASTAETAYKTGLIEPCSYRPLRFCPHQIAYNQDLAYGIVVIIEDLQS